MEQKLRKKCLEIWDRSRMSCAFLEGIASFVTHFRTIPFAQILLTLPCCQGKHAFICPTAPYILDVSYNSICSTCFGLTWKRTILPTDLAKSILKTGLTFIIWKYNPSSPFLAFLCCLEKMVSCQRRETESLENSRKMSFSKKKVFFLTSPYFLVSFLFLEPLLFLRPSFLYSSGELIIH